MSNNRTYVQHAVIKHQLRERSDVQRIASPTASADLALLRAALGLPAAAEVRWSTCR